MKARTFFSILLSFMLLAPGSLLLAQPLSNWTVDMPSSRIPTGGTVADVDTLDSPVTRRFSLSLDATTYDNATASTAFDAIGAATKTAILNTWLASEGIDTSALSIVTVVIKNINRGWDTFDHPDPILQYLVAEDVYWVSGVVRYLVE